MIRKIRFINFSLFQDLDVILQIRGIREILMKLMKMCWKDVRDF